MSAPLTDGYACFSCAHIGVSGTTNVFVWEFDAGQFIARVGISLLGSTNMNADEFERAQWNPFHPEFHDNYAEGFGFTQDEAIDAMIREMKSISEGLFAI